MEKFSVEITLWRSGKVENLEESKFSILFYCFSLLQDFQNKFYQRFVKKLNSPGNLYFRSHFDVLSIKKFIYLK